MISNEPASRSLPCSTSASAPSTGQPKTGCIFRTPHLAQEAALEALSDSSLDCREVGACYFASAVAGSITGQAMLAGEFTLAGLGFGERPVVNVENARTSASTAFHLGWQAVAGGLVDVAAAVGAEKMTHPDKRRSFAAIGGSVDVETAPKELPADRSFLIDLYAAAARHYMQESGATVHDFAAVVVKNQANGALNPLAQYGGNLTVEEVLAAREIVWPFTLPMCSPITDGAAAAVLCARGNGGEVEVRASVLRCADFRTPHNR